MIFPSFKVLGSGTSSFICLRLHRRAVDLPRFIVWGPSTLLYLLLGLTLLPSLPAPQVWTGGWRMSERAALPDRLRDCPHG